MDNARRAVSRRGRVPPQLCVIRIIRVQNSTYISGHSVCLKGVVSLVQDMVYQDSIGYCDYKKEAETTCMYL